MRKGRQMVLLCIAAMLFCTALCFPKEAKAQTEQVTIETGREIYYHQYSTNLFYINGNVGYCLQPAKETPADGIYAGEVLQNNEVLAKAIYFSTGQPGEAVVGEGFWQIPDPEISGVVSWDERYAYSHMFLSWIFADYDFDAAFHGTGLENEVFYEDLKKDFQWKLEHIKGLKVPEAALSFSDSDVTAYIDSEGQRTESLVLSGDPQNEIALPLREKMVLVNESRGTEETGIGHISGGEQFYLRAPIDMKETYQSGEIYGSITNEWRSLIIGTGEDTQIMGVGSYA
ncbi:MAG: thioester domain-containing protein, partial [Faecalimonas sp.]